MTKEEFDALLKAFRALLDASEASGSVTARTVVLRDILHALEDGDWHEALRLAKRMLEEEP